MLMLTIRCGQLEIVVRNTTGWDSGTRFRKGNLGIIPDRHRGDPGIHVGGNIKQTFRIHVPWEEPREVMLYLYYW